ncbi:MAG: hypothetical protein KAH21_04195 [Spirochaetaceae bacterium]|nr:hypothetical protein [Spirochaetaceae bacterium]
MASCSGGKPIEKQLKKLKLEYHLDSEGDYRVQMFIPDNNSGNREVEVGISAHAELLENNVRVRDIWSVAARIPGKIPEGLAENLLKDSWASRKLGAWALAGTTSQGKQVLVYIIRIPESSSLKVLHAALIDCAVSSLGLHDALTVLDGV